MGTNKNNRRKFIKKDKRYKSNPILARDTLEIAQQNLKASKILYESECYPEAIFFLQQSVEKGCKSFGFQLGLINERMAAGHNIGHTTTNVYVVIIEYFKGIVRPVREGLEPIMKKVEGNEADAKLLLSVFSALYTGILDTESKLNSFEDAFRSFANEKGRYSELTEESLDYLLNGLQEIDDKIIDKEKEADYMFDKMSALDDRIKMENHSTVDKYNILNDLNKLSENATNWIALTTLDNLRAITPLLFLAVITQPHEQTSRYVINGKLPKNLFDKDTTIIKEYGKLYVICKNSLSILSGVN